MTLTPEQARYINAVGTPALQREAAQRAGAFAGRAATTAISLVPLGPTIASATGIDQTVRETASDAASSAVSAQGGGLFNWLSNLFSGFMAMVVRFLGNYLGIASTNTAAGTGLLAPESTPEGPVLADGVRQTVAQAAHQARPAQATFAPPSNEAIGIAVASAVADETLSTGSVTRDGLRGAANQARRLFGNPPQQETPEAFGQRLATRAHGSIVRTYMTQHESPELTAAQRETLGAEALAYADRLTGLRLTTIDGRTELRPIDGPPTGLNGYFRAQAESIASPARSTNSGLPLTLPAVTVPNPPARGNGTAPGTDTGKNKGSDTIIGPGTSLQTPGARQNVTSLDSQPESARMAALAEKALAEPLSDNERSFSALPANQITTPGRSVNS